MCQSTSLKDTHDIYEARLLNFDFNMCVCVWINPRMHHSSCFARLAWISLPWVRGLRSRMSMFKFSGSGSGWVRDSVTHRLDLVRDEGWEHFVESPVATTYRPAWISAAIYQSHQQKPAGRCAACYLTWLFIYPLLYTDPQPCYDLLFSCLWY